MDQVLSVFSGGVSGALVVWVAREWISARLKSSISHEYEVKLERLRDELKNRQRAEESKWKLKYDACMQALDLADAMISNMSITGIDAGVMIRESVKTEDVRDCINKLACACDSGEVLNIFKKIVMGNGISLDVVVDLRNEVRKELGFSKTVIDIDRETSFIARIGPV